MSEASSSPSVHLHPLSPSSSMSSTDSAPLSEPTSDEQPDLGAFNVVLREFTHLQPNTRIPVQIRPATSSTTSTFHPGQSVAGSDLPSRSIRSRTSRISSMSSASALSSFTRPPSSSVRPEGSTVWMLYSIAPYLMSQTPVSEEDNSFLDQGDRSYTPSALHSPASTEGGRTVEIVSEPDFLSFEDEDGSHTPNHLDSSPRLSFIESDLPVPVLLDDANPRLDSRETERPEEDVMIRMGVDEDDSSLTSRDIFHSVQQERSSVMDTLGFETHTDSHSLLTSVQVQSQARPATTLSNLSLPLPATSQSSPPSPLSLSTLDDPASLNLPPRSRNPLPPRTVSDSSYTTTASTSSSNLSLLSYQITDAPSISISILAEPGRDPVPVTTHPGFRPPTDPLSVTTSSSSDSNLNSISLKTQQSLAYSSSTASASNSTATYHAQTGSRSVFPPMDDNSVSQSSISANSSTESPFRDPQSPMPTPEPETEEELHGRVDVGASHERPGLHPSLRHRETVADYLETPDQSPSESFPYDPPGSRHFSFRPVEDEDDDARAAVTASSSQNSRLSATDRTTSNICHPSNHDYLHSGQDHSASSAYTRLQPPSNSFSTRHINDEDYDDDYSYRFPHSHTPKTYTQNHAPKGSGSSNSTQAIFQSALASMGPHNSRSEYNNRQQSTSQTLPPSTHVLPNLSQPSQTHQPQAQHMTQSNHRSAQVHALSTNPQPEKKATRVQPFHPPAQLSRGHNYGAGYPHSLLGLHALPVSLVSPDPGELPVILNASSGNSTSDAVDATISATHVAVETEAATEDLFAISDHLPSLGYLDEALDFIASERARLDVAQRVSVASTSNIGGGVEGEVDRNHFPDSDTPKRKRRRKRPVRAHSSTRGAGNPADSSLIADDTKEHVQTPESSPKKKRSKSASASLSSSLLSLPLNQEPVSKGRTRRKGKEKEFLIPPPSLAIQPEDGDGKPSVTILNRSAETLEGHHIFSEDDSDNDDGIVTPTNAGVNQMQGLGESISFLGKKGKRVGRREREREKPIRDSKRECVEGAGLQPLVGPESEFGAQYADHNDDEDDDDGTDPQEEDEPPDGLSGFSLLQPPRKTDRSRRRKARETAHIHVTSGIGGVYKSTPGTPKRRGLDLDEDDHERAGGPRSAEAEDTVESTPSKGGSSSNPSEKRKRSRPKRIKALTHKKSIPQLRLDTQLDGGAKLPVDAKDGVQKLTIKKEFEGKDILDMDRTQFQQVLEAPSSTGLGLLSLSKPAQTQNQPAPQSKRGRMIALAKRLRELFPEQREDLGRVIARFETQGIRPSTKGKKNLVVDGLDLDQSRIAPIAIPGAKKKRSRKRGHVRTGSEGTGGEAVEVEDDFPGSLNAGTRASMGDLGDLDEEGEDEEEELDPRGRPPRKNDILIHVFIDHSNILIGLLSYLKRHPLSQNNTPRTKPLPAVLTKTTTTVSISPTSAFAAVKSTTARPLPIPGLGTGNGPGPPASRSQAVPIPSASKPPIPLPSFAMLSRSLPAGPILSAYNGENGKNTESDDDGQRKKDKAANSDGYEHPDEKDRGLSLGHLFAGGSKYKKGKEMKSPRHLWHAALALILERGRPVTRRVVVTSSPLYQPMESIEHLGYELRVFIRVPDLGNGMDRDKRSGKSSTISKGSQSSPVTSVSFSGLPVPQKQKPFGHGRHLSESASAESGSGSAGSSNPHPYHRITTSSAPPAKIKYREQGVDELLQLKLHQALAATDDVPVGSTIVLATGDGNMGQFNEDGFLGPVRTALKRGWKVELYAWEDGLSRAWRREFGETSEWGRKGMFRVIAMEQFANALVEASAW